MGAVYRVTGYRTSRNYSRLWELAKAQSIICLCDFPGGARDVAHTIADSQSCQVSERGTCFVSASSFSDFSEQCRACHLEWIEPNA
jgi:hypothetical protein